MIYRFEPQRDDEDRHEAALLDETELERLADFYHKSGFYQEAIETLDELMSVRHGKECDRIRTIRRAS